uniref:G-protein coupled receptors family 3 profile domain-containing protein n=1 Tax=Periophthalmus magnuspinnatus TaxID=409849 RepID=A0A3B4AJ23_9GOBI
MKMLQKSMLFSLLHYANALSSCKLLGPGNLPSLFQEGEIMIGGIFPVYNKEIFNASRFPSECTYRFNLRVFRWTQVMIFAIEEVNRSLLLLPNVTVGYMILNSCSSPSSALQAALAMAGGVGRTQPPACTPAVSALIVSYFSTCACLSDRAKFPSFFRTIPSDYFQAKALAALVKHFNWHWIGAVQSDDDYGRNGVSAFIQEAKKLGVCVAFVGTVLRTYSMDKILKVVDMIKMSSVKVVLGFAPEGDMYPLMLEIVKQNITGIQWLASEAWITAAVPSTPEMYPSFGGALGFVMHKRAIPKLKSFLTDINPYASPEAAFVKEFWEDVIGCTPNINGVTEEYEPTKKLCTGKETLKDSDHVFFDVTQLRASYNVYNAVYAVAHALHQLLFCQAALNQTFKQCKKVSEISPKLHHGDVECTPCPEEYWSNSLKNACIPKTVEYLSYQEPMGIAVTFVSLMGTALSMATMLIFILYRDTPVIKASNTELSCFLLFSLFLCFLCPLTFIGKPTMWTCVLRHTAFGVTFAFCMSCVLGRTIVVVAAFKATFPGNSTAVKFGHAQQRIIVGSCTLVQILICAAWLNISPPFPDRVFKYSNTKIVLECNTGSQAAFCAVLGYIGLLAITCLVLAFLARKLPDNFNEAKFITFSMLIFCAVWITFIPAYVSSPGKFTVAVEIFAILSSAFGLLISIFAPKCYIILIKPEKNTKKYMMRKI